MIWLLSDSIPPITILSTLAAIAIGIYGVTFGIRKYSQKIRQDKMQTLLNLIRDFRSEKLVYSKKILTLKVIRPEKSWKNSADVYEIEWKKILAGDCEKLNRYLISELNMKWVRLDQKYRTEGNTIVTESQEFSDGQKHTLVICPDEYTELIMDEIKQDEPIHQHRY